MDNKSLYLDNAATTYPKPHTVATAVADYIENVGINIKRGGYSKAYTAAEAVLTLRERLNSFFNGPDPRNVIFTANVTTSLNFLLKGFLKPGDHVITTCLEHNAVTRPLVQLQELSISFDVIPPDNTGRPDLTQAKNLIKTNTKAIVSTHASNVSGTVIDIAYLGELAAKHGLKLIVDSAQSAGVLPLDMQQMGIDALAFTGHKGLLGPQGIGGFIISEEMAAKTTPLIAGGTGSFSHLETMPELLPDRFEAGTMNLPGMAGLLAGLDYIEQLGVEKIHGHEQQLANQFMEGLTGNKKIRIIGADYENRVAVISLDFISQDNGEIAFALANDYGIMTRCGLHCAPRAHQSVGTYPQGTVRFSPGIFTTADDIDYAVKAISELTK